MKKYHRKPAQFELFPRASGQPVKESCRREFFKKLTLSSENLVALGVVLVMSMVVSFSWGVERGKTAAAQEAGQEPAGQPRIVQVRPAAEEPAVSQAVHLKKTLAALPVHGELRGTPEIKSAGFSMESVKNSVKSVFSEVPKKKVDNPYTVQVASFRKKKYADQEALGLKKKGYEIFVVPKGEYSIVCVGKFAYKTEADRMSQKLKKRYKDCLVRSL